MKHAAHGVRNYQGTSLLLSVLAIAAFSIGVGFFPAYTHADIVSANTQQLVPPGGNTCAAPHVSEFTPYVYGDSLDAFEFTVSDASYVALGGTVGNESVPFQFMTRRVDAQNRVRIHVDLNSMPVGAGLTMRVMLISARGPGIPVCAADLVMQIGEGSVSVTQPVVQSTPTVSPAMPAPVEEAVSQPTAPAPSETTEGAGTGESSSSTQPVSATGTGISASGTSATTGTSVLKGVGETIRGLCSSGESAFRLWLILLIAYALIVGLLLWAEFPLSLPWARTPERIATIILAALLLLLGFWYFAVSCRAALWMPLLAFLIAILGLLAAFWNHPRVTQLLLIEEAKRR